MGLSEELKKVQRQLMASPDLTNNIAPALGTLAQAIDISMISWKELQAKVDAQEGKDVTKQQRDINRLKATRLNLRPEDPIAAAAFQKNPFLERPPENTTPSLALTNAATVEQMIAELIKRQVRPEALASTQDSGLGTPLTVDFGDHQSGELEADPPSAIDRITEEERAQIKAQFEEIAGKHLQNNLNGYLGLSHMPQPTTGTSNENYEITLGEVKQPENVVIPPNSDARAMTPEFSGDGKEREGEQDISIEDSQDGHEISPELSEFGDETEDLLLTVLPPMPESFEYLLEETEIQREDEEVGNEDASEKGSPEIANSPVIHPDEVTVEDTSGHDLKVDITLDDPLIPLEGSGDSADNDLTAPAFAIQSNTMKQIAANSTKLICIIKSLFISTAPDLLTARDFDVIINVAAEVQNPFPAEDVMPPKDPYRQQATQNALTNVGQGSRFLSPHIFGSGSRINSNVPTGSSSPGIELVNIPDNSASEGQQDGLEYLHVTWGPYYSEFSESLDYLCLFLADRVSSGKKILIHGNSDYQRPSMLVFAYHMFSSGEPYFSSLGTLRACSTDISLTPEMENQLIGWARLNLPALKRSLRSPPVNTRNTGGVTDRGFNTGPIQKEPPSNYLTTSHVRRRRVDKGSQSRANTGPSSPAATTSSSNASASNTAPQPAQNVQSAPVAPSAQNVPPTQNIQPAQNVQPAQSIQAIPPPGACWDDAPLIVALGFQKSHNRILMIRLWIDATDDDEELLGKICQKITQERGWLKRWLSFKKLGRISIMPYQQLDTPDSDEQRCFVTLTSMSVGPPTVAHLEYLNGYCPQLVYQLNRPPSSLGNQMNWIRFATALDKLTLPNATATTGSNPPQPPSTAINPPQQQQQRRPQFLLYLTEVWSTSRMAWFTMFWLVSSLIISLGYAIVKDDNQTGFGIGAYVLTWGSTLVAVLAIAVSVI
ncbi:tyrosine/serine/threonine protein phosphatase [Rhizina undulata]